MHYTKFTKRDFLYKLDEITAFSIRRNEIRDAVSGYGYDQARLKEGRDLWEKLKMLHVEAYEKSALKRDLFAKKKRFQNKIHKIYMKFLKLARIAFSNDIEAQEALMLTGARSRTYDKWIEQVSVFVNNILSSEGYIEVMAGYGIEKKDFVSLKSEVTEMRNLSDRCIKVTATVRMINDRVKRETIVVQRWVSSYLKVARIALEENPEVLALLGIGDKN